MAYASLKKRICIVGCGPSGLSVLYHFDKLSDEDIPEIVCYEKQSTWGGLWNINWRTGFDEYGEHCHGSMYHDMWVNGPKEQMEYPDYTFDDHFGKPIPAYVTRPVIRDYLNGRFSNATNRSLKQFVRFSTVVRRIVYHKPTDDFIVVVHDLKENIEETRRFSHVIVATGIFSYPNQPHYPGFSEFQGRIMHSKDVKYAQEFKGKRVLLIGSSWSAEDLALQCLKYGAKHITISWRTAPLGFRWPQAIEERAILQKLEGRTAYFKDGTTAEIDVIVLCTGYICQFPFLEDSLKLKEQSFYPNHLYKGVLWMNGGNDKLLYIGTQDSVYSIPMFETQALWACQYITGAIALPEKSQMLADIRKWLTLLSKVNITNVKDCIRFMTDYLHEMVNSTGYPIDAILFEKMLDEWAHHKDKDILSYRDHQFQSMFTGKITAASLLPWMEAFDDSLDAFFS